jgi:geranylgeranyl diphosphate synthase type II
VLAGDALLALAFETLARAGEPAERVLAAVADLARAAGSRELVGGQADDLAFEPSAADAARIESVHRRKTAALFGAAVVGGARLGGAGAGALERLARFAACLGVAFQIVDDVLDGAGDGDAGCSLAALLGEEGARARAERLLAQALEALEAFGAPAEPLRELARFAVARDR